MFRMLMLVVLLAVWGGSSPAYSQETPEGVVEQVAPDAVEAEVESALGAVVGPMLPAEEGAPNSSAVEPVVEEPIPVPPEVDLDALESMTKTPVGLSLLVGFIVWFVMEIGKALIKKFGEASTGVKWAVSVLSGAVFGLLFGLFGGVTFPWWVALLSGMAGSASFSGVRQLRNSFRPVNSNGFGQVGFLVLLVIMSAGVLYIGAVGCGATFTAKAGDEVIQDIKPTKPAYSVIEVNGDEVCRLDVPEGTIELRNICKGGEVSTFAPDGVTPTCVPNPCPPGQAFTFESSGLAVCK